MKNFDMFNDRIKVQWLIAMASFAVKVHHDQMACKIKSEKIEQLLLIIAVTLTILVVMKILRHSVKIKRAYKKSLRLKYTAKDIHAAIPRTLPTTTQNHMGNSHVQTIPENKAKNKNETENRTAINSSATGVVRRSGP